MRIKGLLSSKSSKLYAKSFIAVAVLFAVALAIVAVAETPLSIPRIITGANATTSSNVTSAFATNTVFGFANFTSTNGTTEENSTFKWYVRTEYQPQNRSLVGYWKLDGNGNDSSSFGNRGTVVGAVDNQSRNCKVDNCLYFNGSNVVNVSSSAILNATLNVTQVTVEAWVKINATGNDNTENVVAKFAPSSYWYLRENVGDWQFSVNAADETGSRTVYSATGDALAWHHLAGTYDGSTVRLYRDGILVNSTSWTGGMSANSGSVGIGGFADTPSQYFFGSIDEVALYNYAKTASEVYSDYKDSPYTAMIYKDAVAYWHFDRGNWLNDRSGQGNNGDMQDTANNATNVTGIIGDALSFDGSNDFIDFGNKDAFTFNNVNLSVAAWVKISANTSGEHSIVCKCTTGAGANDEYELIYIGGDTSRFQFFASDGTNFGTVNSNTFGAPKVDAWYYLVGTYDATNDLVSIYVNGINDTNDYTFGSADNNINLRIGYPNNGNANEHFNGVIDEVAIYNKTLTASEVKQLYLRSWYDVSPQAFLLSPNYPEQLANDTQNTTLLLHFDEGSGATARDSSPYGNSGSISGAFFTNDSISGSALSFDGTDDSVSVPHNDTLNFNVSDPFTFSAWFKWNGYVDTNKAGGIAMKGSFERSYGIDFTPQTSTVQGGLRNSSGTVFSTSYNAIKANQWYHAVMTNNPSTELVSLYVNGKLRGTKSTANAGATGNTAALVIGGSSILGGTAGAFPGVIDEIKIVNRTLTAAEVAADYRKSCPFCTSDAELPTATSGVTWQPGRFVSNLTVDGNVVGYWRADDVGSGSSGLRDQSLYGNNGTIFGAIFVNDSAGGTGLNLTLTDYVNVTPSSSLNLSGNFSFELWMKLDELPGGLQAFIDKGRAQSEGWSATVNPEGGSVDVNIEVTGTASQSTLTACYSGDASLGSESVKVWRHIAGVFTKNATNGTTIIYIDGIEINRTTNQNGGCNLNINKNEQLLFGKRSDSQAFKGTLDEVRIINRSLTASEILADYRAAAKGLGLLSNDYVNYSASGNFNEREGTIEFWVKPEWNGNNGIEHDIFDTMQNDGSGTNWLIYKRTNNALSFTGDNIGGTGDTRVQYDISDWLAGDWHNIAVTWNNYTSNRTLHIDGTQVNSSSNPFVISNTQQFILGSNAIAGSNPSNMTISEFRISKKALTAQEINFSYSKARQFFQNEYMINASNYDKGNSLKLEYVAKDQDNQTGTLSNTTSLTILNSKPSEPTITDFGRVYDGSGSGVVVADNLATAATAANATFINAINITWNPSADNDTDTIHYTVLVNYTAECRTTAVSCNITALTEGFHIFNVTAFDGAENSTTTLYAFNYDNTTPALTEVAPTIANSSFINTTSAFINFSLTETHVDRFIVNLTSTAATGSSAFNSFNGINTTIWDKELVGMWHFEEQNGTATANDSSGFRNDGTLNGINASNESTISGFNTSAGRLGGGIKFDGRDDYVDGNEILGFERNQPFSVSLWFKRDVKNDNFHGLVAKMVSTGNAEGWMVSVPSATVLRFQLRSVNGDPDSVQLSATGLTISVNTWQHFAATYAGNSSASGVTMYQNGEKLTLTTDENALVSSILTSASFNIGARDDGVGPANGTIDEVKIWERALTAAEISAEYNRTASNYLTSHAVSGNAHTFSLNMTNLTNGNYTWFVWVNDSAGNVNSTQSKPSFLTVDTIAPAISFVANTPANASMLSSGSILVNTTESSGDSSSEMSALIDFNRSLVGWWRFEEGSGTILNDSSTYGNTGTTTASTNRNTAGKRGSAIRLDGNNDYANIPHSASLNVTDAITLEAWVRPEGISSDPGNNRVLSKDGDSAYQMLFTDSGARNFLLNLYLAPGVGETNIQDRTINASNNTWYHVAGTYNGTHMALYINGNLTNLTARTGKINYTTGALGIGYKPVSSDNFFNGSIDEVKVWSRALSAAEVNASYSAGVYRLQNNFTGLGDGNYTVKAYVVDAAGSINSTEARNYTIDTTTPAIAFGEDAELQNSNLSRAWLFVNVTVLETFVKNVSIELWNTTALVNRTNFTVADGVVDGGNLTFRINFSNLELGSAGLPDDIYNFNATVYDMAENNARTGTRTATIDATIPFIAYGLNSDANASFLSRNWTFLNFSYTELNNNTFLIRNGSTNWTNVNAVFVGGSTGYFYYNFTNLNNANYSFYGWINDTAANVNQTVNRTFYIDTTAPAITFGAVTELHNANVSRKWLFVNVTVSENYVKNVSIELWNTSATGSGRALLNRTNFTVADGVVDGSNVTFQVNFTNLPLQGSGLADDVYYFNATVYDLAESSARTGTRTGTVDTTPPNIAFGLNVLSNGSTVTSNSVLMNFSYTELNNATFMIRNGSTNWTNVDVVVLSGSSGYFSYTFANLNEGTYSFFGWINDTAGHANQTANRTIIIDSVAPAGGIVPYSIANSSFINVTYALINFSTTESGEHSSFVDFNNSLVGYWRFEDDGDTNASDFTNNNNNGSMTGFGCTLADCNLTGGAGGVASGFVSSGKRGKAVAFDGTGDYVEINSVASANVIGDQLNATVEAWVKPLAGGGRIFSHVGTADPFNTFEAITRNSDTGTITFSSKTTDGQSGATSSTRLKNDTWYYVVATQNLSRHFSVYINGVLETTAQIPASRMNAASAFNMAFIGAFNNTNDFFNGTIDEVKVWNRVLSAQEINASYSAGTYRLERNFTGLSEGNYTWSAYVVDSSGQLRNTSLQSFSVDTFTPPVTIDSTSTGQYAFVRSALVNITANDTANNHNDFSAFIDVNRSLVGYWRFEEGAGRNATDFSSYGNNGNMTNFSCLVLNCNLSSGTGGSGSGWTSAGKRGNALLFDGEGTFVNVTDSSSLDVANITIEAWIKISGFATGQPSIVGKARGSQRSYLIDVESSGQKFRLGLSGAGSSLNYTYSDSTLSAGTWYHVAGTYNGTTVVIYINGREENKTSSSLNGDIFSSTTELMIGTSGLGQVFNGTIDEVKIWNRALFPVEINASYAAGTYRLQRAFGGSDLPDGNHTFNATAIDAAGNINYTTRSIVIDNTPPAINAVRIYSNATGNFWVSSNASGSSTAYFNSIAGTSDGLGGGGGQIVTFEVAYSDLYRNSVAGNLTFSDTPANHTRDDPTRINYSIETGSDNATAAIYANDTANNSATATVRFIMDINDTVTNDNTTSSRGWTTYNRSIKINATDTLSGANRTYFCISDAGATGCIPNAVLWTTSGIGTVAVNCSASTSCQQVLRYYSIDNVSNNESGGINGGLIRNTSVINIATGNADIDDTLSNFSIIENGAYVRGSNLSNSTVDGCIVLNSFVYRSAVRANSSLVHNCTISGSTVIDTNLTASEVFSSYVDPSTIYDSVITNSNVTNASVFFSRIENSTFCAPNFFAYSATVLNNTLISGRISHNGTNYFGPFALQSICQQLPSGPVGGLQVNATAFHNLSSIRFTYTATEVGRTVWLSRIELARIDNVSTANLYLNDNGTYPDVVLGDAVYEANFTISSSHNVSDGTKTLLANVSDNLGNELTLKVNVTIDNSAPNASIIINGGTEATSSRIVPLSMLFNDTFGVQDCRLAGEDRLFDSFAACAESKTWTLSNGDGNKTVVLQVRDNAGVIKEVNDSILLNTTNGTVLITQPNDNTIHTGNITIKAVAPDSAEQVIFTIYNGSTWNTTFTDTNPVDGWEFVVNTSHFKDRGDFQVMANATDILGLLLGFDHVVGLTFDNTIPGVNIASVASSTVVSRQVKLNVTSNENLTSVRYDYRTGSGEFTIIGTAVTPPFNILWDTTTVADATNYEIRANATDGAGLSNTSSATSVEIDNTAPAIAIVSPTQGATVSGTTNVSFTIIGATHGRQIQFDGGSWTNTDATTYSWNTQSYTDGSHIFRVKANDTQNNTGYSDITLVQVDNGGAPVIILSPGSGGYQSGSVAISVSAPGTTFNVTFNVSNSTGFFNLTGYAQNVTVDNTSASWQENWVTTAFAEDGTYTVLVSAYDASNTLLGTDSITSVEVDNLIPVNATNLTIHDFPVDNDGLLTLVWNASTSPDIDHYNLYRSQTQNFTFGSGTFIKSVTSAGTTDSVPTGTWFYKITSVDNVGRESNASNEANTTVTLVGPTGTLAVNKSVAKDNDTIKLTFTSSQTGLTAMINASRTALFDSRTIETFETLWTTSNSTALNITLNSSSKQEGAYSNELTSNGSALNANITFDLSAGGAVNLSLRNTILVWVQANITGNILNFSFGEQAGNYTQGNFTISIGQANKWEQKNLTIAHLEGNQTDAVRYLRFNVTTSSPFRMLLDLMQASSRIDLKDDGIGEDSVASDAVYTAQYNISADNNISDGTKTITALVDDGANFLSPTATITIDNTPPFSNISVADGATHTTTTSVVLSVAFSDSNGVVGCRFSNTGTFTSDFESCSVLKAWALSGAGGEKNVYMQVKDAAGNMNTSNDSIIYDNQAPSINVTYPSPGARVNGTINITFVGVETDRPEVSVDGGNYTFTTGVNFHMLNTTNLTEGSHTIIIKDIDAAGNIGKSDPLLVIVDNIKGAVTITQPLSGSVLNRNVSVVAIAPENTKNVTFFLQNSTHTYPVHNDTIADGWNFTLDTTRFADASGYSIRANATDDSGMFIDSDTASNLEIDNTAPTVTLASPVGSVSYRGTIFLEASVSESDIVNVAFYYSNDSGTSWYTIGSDLSNESGWTFLWDTTTVNDGSTYRVRANATDNAGLPGSGQTASDFTIDNTAPAVNITAPQPGTFVKGVVNVTISGNETRFPKIRIDGGAFVNMSSNGGAVAYYLWNTTNTTIDGTHTLQAMDNDSVGNTGLSSIIAVVVDNTVPTVTITTPTNGTNITGTITVIAIASGDTKEVKFYVDNTTGFGGAAAARNDTDGTDGWTFTMDTTRFCTLCTAQIRAQALDNASNSANYTVSNIEIDNEAPAVTIVVPASGSTYSGTLKINATTDAADVKSVFFEYSPNGGTTYTAIGTDFSYANNWTIDWNTREVSDGSNYVVRATATDDVGKQSVAATGAFTIDNPAAVGTLSVNDSIVKDGDTILFRFTGSATDLNVTINKTQLALLDNTSTFDLALEDAGLFPDAVADDAVYTNNYTIGSGNNISDGVVQLAAIVNDTFGNTFLPTVNITLDNAIPNASIIINGNDVFTTTRVVDLRIYFNDSLAGVQDCRIANENQAFGEWNECSTALTWTLSSGNAVKTVVVQVRDNAGNVNMTNDTIELTTVVAATTVIEPERNSYVNGNVTVTAIAPDNAKWVLFAVYNGTRNSSLDGSIGFTNDTTVADGWSGSWNATAFAEAVYNVTAIAYDVNGNHISNGSATNITVDKTAPNISMAIFGTSVAGFANVSTEYTISRGVMLSIGYNDSLSGADICRFANENQIFTSWEGCTTAKSWLLSDGAGNKTVLIQVKDRAGNLNATNDTIFFNITGAGLDVTPPLTPTVVDDGKYTNTNAALHAAWNSTDHENELLHAPLEFEYRIHFNSTTGTIGYLNATWQFVGAAAEVTEHRLNLTDGNNYTFEVRAINTAGLRSSTGKSDGIIVDVSAPTTPGVNSTHNSSQWSLNNNVRFNWTAMDSISNISAYSYALDKNATTIPDNVPEAETEHALLKATANDGGSTALKYNLTGSAQAAYIEVRSNVSVGDVLRVTMQLAESHVSTADLMGVSVYAIDATPTAFDMTASNISGIVNATNNLDHVDDLRDATSYIADIQVNTVVTDGGFYVAVAGMPTVNNSNYNVLLAHSNTTGLDTTTQNFACLQGGSGCTNTTNSTEYAVKVEQRDLRSDNIWDRTYSVGDGMFHFHVKAQDKAGNFGSTAHYTIMVDTSAPSTPQMTQPSQTTVNITQLTFNWTQSTDPESGVGNYSLQVDNNSDWSSPEFNEWVNNVTNYTVTGLSVDTTYNARVLSKNQAGVNSSYSNTISQAVDTTAPVITLSKPSGTVVTNNIVVVANTNEKAVCQGRESTDAYTQFAYTNSTYHETKATLSSGSGAKTYDIKCADTANNEGTASLSITVDTTATPSTVTLQTPSVFTNSIVTTNVSVKTSSGAGLGEIGKSQFTISIGGNAKPFSLFDIGNGNYTAQFTSPATNGSYSYSVTAAGVEGTSTLTVNNLLFVVQYTQSGITSNKKDKLIYYVAGNFSIGLASDSRSVSATGTSSALNLSANAEDGEVFVFVTRTSGSVERVEDLLKDRTFLDNVNPSFGYQLDQDTFVVFTDLEYADIALSGNDTLTTGKYNLVLENQGFDTTVNKTKLVVTLT